MSHEWTNADLLALDELARDRMPERRGFGIADARDAEPTLALIHARAGVGGDAPGLLRSLPDGPFPDRLPPGYLLFLFHPEALAPGHPALGLVEQGELLAIGAREREGRIELCDARGEWQPIASGRLRPSQGVTIEVGGVSLGEHLLPATIQVRLDQRAGAVHARVSVPDREPLEVAAALSLREGSSGEGTVRLDLVPDPNGADALRLTVLSFEPEVAVTPLVDSSLMACRPAFHRRWLKLHVLFDRTSLDAAAWPLALAGSWSRPSSGPVQEGAFAAPAAPQTRAPERWNLDLRAALAAGLADSIHALHSEVTLALWWFADLPHPDRPLAPPAGLPLASALSGSVGQCTLEALAHMLEGPHFHYATGLDFVDAVDAGTQMIHRAIAVDRDPVDHAVLIVSDSAPPASSETCPIFRWLAQGPPQTDLRRSTVFVDSLAALHERGVPVGWLFPRDLGPAEGLSGKPGVARQYSRFWDLRERTLQALRELPHLEVAEAGSREPFAPVLEQLFSRMRQRAPALAVALPVGLPRISGVM